MKKLSSVLLVVLVVLLASCQTVSLPAPTAEEAKDYKDTHQEVLASAGFGGFADAVTGESKDGEYKAGDKLGLNTVTQDGHVKIDVDLSGMLQGDQSISYDIDIAYKPIFGDEKSIVYVAKTTVENGSNVTTLKKAELNGKAFDPAAMQSMISE